MFHMHEELERRQNKEMLRLDQAHSMDMPYDLGHTFHYTSRWKCLSAKHWPKCCEALCLWMCGCLAFSNMQTEIQGAGPAWVFILWIFFSTPKFQPCKSNSAASKASSTRLHASSHREIKGGRWFLMNSGNNTCVKPILKESLNSNL